MTLSASIVTFNNADVIDGAVTSLLNGVPADLPATLTVVDNGSRDGTVQVLEECLAKHQSVRLIRSPRNLGYGGGHNLAIRDSISTYHLISNPDIVVRPGAIRELLQCLDEHPDVAMVGPRFLNPDGTLQPLNKRFPNVLDLFLRRFAPRAIKRMARNRMDRYEMRDVGYERSCDVPTLSGAFMLCRTDVLQAVGGFDERYFMYFEDADLCRRIQSTHRTLYCADAIVVHRWERAAHRNWRMTLTFISSGLKYFRRWGWELC